MPIPKDILATAPRHPDVSRYEVDESEALFKDYGIPKKSKEEIERLYGKPKEDKKKPKTKKPKAEDALEELKRAIKKALKANDFKEAERLIKKRVRLTGKGMKKEYESSSSDESSSDEESVGPIHIDIASHNAKSKGKNSTSGDGVRRKVKGGTIQTLRELAYKVLTPEQKAKILQMINDGDMPPMSIETMAPQLAAQAAPKVTIRKRIGNGFAKGSQKAKEIPDDLIHIDIDSHNAKGKSSSGRGRGRPPKNSGLGYHPKN